MVTEKLEQHLTYYSSNKYYAVMIKKITDIIKYIKGKHYGKKR